MERISSYSSSSAWDKIKTQYVYDGRGSVAQELSNNNSWYTFGGALSKTTRTSYSYTPFGELLNSSTAKTTFFAYNGESYDSATGMVNLRARQYETAMMRFAQRGIWHGKVEMPTSQNRYLYCINDPIGYCDRSGNRVDEDAGKPKKVKPRTSATKPATHNVASVECCVNYFILHEDSIMGYFLPCLGGALNLTNYRIKKVPTNCIIS